MEIILASASPRRKEILSKLIPNFKIIPSSIDEVLDESLDIYSQIEKIAYCKAIEIANKYQNDLIISADTVVYIDNEVLGKPKDRLDAKRMITKLSGNTHEVITGVCVIYNKEVIKYHEISLVTFKKMTEDEIDNYINIYDIYDKAGAYAIQGDAKKYVLSYSGEYENIVGLPVIKLKKILEKYSK